MSGHPIVHIEFSAANADEAGKFYREMFDWEIQSWPEYNYATFKPQEGLGGGFAIVDGLQYKTGDVVVYISTEDLEGDLQKIAKAGGKTLLPRTAIDDNSWYAFFQDPFGNRVGLYTLSAARDFGQPG